MNHSGAMNAVLITALALAGLRKVELAVRHQVTHLGMPDFRPAAGRSSGTGNGP